jgi:hypothetical protein
MFMIYLHIKFHVPSSNGSLDITLKKLTTESFCMVTMLLFYIL